MTKPMHETPPIAHDGRWTPTATSPSRRRSGRFLGDNARELFGISV